MTDRPNLSPNVRPSPGLCETCRHSRQIVARRGAVYRRCERSLTDPVYPRYPNLPVLDCLGFEAAVPTD